MPVGIQVQIKDLNALKGAFSGFPETIAPFLRTASTKSALKVEGEAKKVTPVDTGRLRSSIATSLGIMNKGITSIVSTNLFYAIFVHEGTRRMRGRPFMQQGVDASMSYIEQVYREEIGKSLDLLARQAR